MTPTLLAVVIGIGAPAQNPVPPKGDPLVGRWAAIQVVINGQDHKKASGELEYELTADGKWVIYQSGKPMAGRVRTYTADAKKKPAAIDLTERDTGPYPGIYHVDGDTLTLVFHIAQGDRPTDLSDRSAGIMAVILTRVKTKD